MLNLMLPFIRLWLYSYHGWSYNVKTPVLNGEISDLTPAWLLLLFVDQFSTSVTA